MPSNKGFNRTAGTRVIHDSAGSSGVTNDLVGVMNDLVAADAHESCEQSLVRLSH